MAAQLLAAGCGSFEPRPPESARDLGPIPARFPAWWRLTEQCAGVRGDLSAVHWLVVPATAAFSAGGVEAQGAWYSRGNRIALVEGEVTDGELVRHEMLHALLRVAGHPRDVYLGRCADIVACGDACARDAGGAVVRDDRAPVRTPDAIEVTTAVVPDSVVRPGGERTWVTVTVSARNPAPVPVRVRVPLSIGAGPADGGIFGYYGEGLGGGASLGDSLVAFGPHETRRRTFDVVIEPGAAGERRYAVVGRFADHRAPAVPLTVRRDSATP